MHPDHFLFVLESTTAGDLAFAGAYAGRLAAWDADVDAGGVRLASWCPEAGTPRIGWLDAVRLWVGESPPPPPRRVAAGPRARRSGPTKRPATILVREAIHLDSAVIGLSGLASQSGPVADVVRKQIVAAGWECSVEVLGGQPLSALFAALWKQSMLDNFLAWYAMTVVWPERAPAAGEQEAIDMEELADAEPGLFELLCSLNTPGWRDRTQREMGMLYATALDDTFVGSRSGGTVSSVLAGLADGGFCDAWNSLSAPDRCELSSLIERLISCQPAFFDLETFNGGNGVVDPRDLTGLHDRAGGPETNTDGLAPDREEQEEARSAEAKFRVPPIEDLAALRQAEWLAALRAVQSLSVREVDDSIRFDTRWMRWLHR